MYILQDIFKAPPISTPAPELPILLLRGGYDVFVSKLIPSDSTAPTVSTLSPLDNAIDIAIDSNLVLTFSEAVDVESGNITLKKTSDDSTVEAIDVTGGLVTGTGTTIITVNPTADLSNSTAYYVQIAATAFEA